MNTPKQSGRVALTVCYLTPAVRVVRDVQLPRGASVLRALHASGILQMCPDINLEHNKVGIFSKIVPLETKAQDGDRIEIYRPVTAKGKRILMKKDKTAL